MTDKTVLDKLVKRLDEISRDITQDAGDQDALEREVSDVGILLSGLEKIAGLLTETFNDIDKTLLSLRVNQERHRRRLQDSLASISTILTNYPKVFVKLDADTVQMFLKNIDRETLRQALVQTDAEIINEWYSALAMVLWTNDEDKPPK